jgi:hypothetical protein
MDERIAPRKATKSPTGIPVVLAESTDPNIRTEALHLSTEGAEEFWDVTDLVRGVVSRT